MTDSHMEQKKNGQLGLRGHLGVLVAIFMILTGFLLAVTGYHLLVKTRVTSIQEQVNDTTTIIKGEVMHTVRQPVQFAVTLLSDGLLPAFSTAEQRFSLLPVLKGFMNNYPIISSVYIGYENGDFFLIDRMSTEAERRDYNAPPQAVFRVRSIDHGEAENVDEMLFYDASMRLLLRRREEVAYDPRTSPWYQDGMRASGRVDISPYIIARTKTPAMTFVKKTHTGASVMGADVLLADLSAVLRRELPTPGARLALIQSDGTLIGSPVGMVTGHGDAMRLRTQADISPIMQLAAQAYAEGRRGRGILMSDGERDWVVSLEQLTPNRLAEDALLLAIPEDDLVAGGRQFLSYALVGVVGMLILCSPIVWLAARRLTRPLRSLAERAGTMHEFLRDQESGVLSGVSEIQALAGSMQFLQDNVRRMLTITQALNSERDFDALLQRVLQETLSLVNVDGGVLALLDDEKRTLLNQGFVCWVRDGQQETHRFTDEVQPDMRLATYRALAQDKTVQTSITRDDPRRRLVNLEPAFADPEVVELDVVCVPLRDRMGDRIGALVLFKTLRADGVKFHPDEINFIETFAATAAIALDNNRLLKGQNELRDALIHIIAGAIDAKSPYTGGHCQRVPVIFQMLLEAACEAQDGPFRDFVLDESGWEEAKLAGWLHDCGKVTTPEYVVDKATKLETIYDRIHEIRTRFEVLKRDAEIASLRSELNGADPERARLELEKELRALDNDFAFVASCNAGSEYMGDAALHRLQTIGKRTWMRTLDKRLGVSRDERARIDHAGMSLELPVRETLLMDNPEHIIERGEKDTLDTQNPWGFRLMPPQALYNRGELYNLSVRSGTLSAEERYKINDHITRTIMMLEAMPLPRHLRNVPEIVGAHHETMDGQGYPRGLKREHMSWGARMMAIADIFEALTAWDRPYKASKTLREALGIMRDLRERNHIDPDVFSLFLQAEIPQRYASGYLKPDQNNL